jgi:hypothetical protein
MVLLVKAGSFVLRDQGYSFPVPLEISASGKYFFTDEKLCAGSVFAIH